MTYFRISAAYRQPSLQTVVPRSEWCWLSSPRAHICRRNFVQNREGEIFSCSSSTTYRKKGKARKITFIVLHQPFLQFVCIESFQRIAKILLAVSWQRNAPLKPFLLIVLQRIGRENQAQLVVSHDENRFEAGNVGADAKLVFLA